MKSVLSLLCAALAAYAANATTGSIAELLRIKADLERYRAEHVARTNSPASARMASTALLDRRIREAKDQIGEATARQIYDLHTNLDARINRVYRHMDEVLAAEAERAATNATRSARNMEVVSRMIGYELAGDIDAYFANCTRTSIVVTAASNRDLSLVYLAYPGKGASVTSAIYNVSSTYHWDTSTYDFVTEDGEVYVSIPQTETNGWGQVIRTYICTTNSSRFVKTRPKLIDDKSWRIVLGKE